MTLLTTRFALLGAVIAIALTQSGASQAGLLPVNVTVTKDADNYRYSYGVVLTTDSMLRSGDFFTIYDFQGYIAGNEVTPDGFTFSSAAVGPTPNRIVPTDDNALSNVTWTYTGPDIVVGQTGLGNFMVQSQYGNTTDGVFAAITHREVGTSTESNITQTEVPVPAGPGLPEPSSLALIGMGLPLLGLVRLLRRS